MGKEVDTMNEYQAQALKFLDDTGTIMKIKFDCKRKPAWLNEYVNSYRFELRTSFGKMGGTFYDSLLDTRLGNKPNEYDILSCLTKYDPGAYEEFCSEYGYDPYDTETRKTYNAVKSEYSRLSKIYTPKQMEMLREII